MSIEKELDDFIKEIAALPDKSEENKRRLDIIEKKLGIKKQQSN